MPFNKQAIIAVDVYLEKRKSREYVGQLKRLGNFFQFSYDESYIYGKASIPLGPDLPASKLIHKSKVLFPSFEDRIPSKQNAAYEEYCKNVGISTGEKDPLVLLSTLGQRGPSSFIYVPVTEETWCGDKLKKYREELSLTVREFADLFDFAPTTITGIENRKTSGKDALKRISIYINFPETALNEAKKNSHKIQSAKWRLTEQALSEKIAKK